MKKSIFAIILMAISSVSYAEGEFSSLKPYVSLNIGASFLDDTEVQDLPSNTIDFDGDVSFGGAVGVHLDPVRLEFEITHRNHDIDSINVASLGGLALPISGDVDFTTIMFNVLYDFHPEFLPEPMGFYVGGGIGISLFDVELKAAGASASDDDSVFSYQLLLGTSYKINEKTMLTLQYRLLLTDEPDIGGSDLDELIMHGIEFGVRFNF